MNKETVCAVVVTYNRKDLLLECLEGLRKQTRPVDAIYLVDNASTDGTPELLLEKGYIKELPPLNIVEPWEKEFEVENFVDHQSIKIHYVRMHENTGGAGGFYEGMKRAYEKTYDWFWLMDDDVEPAPNCLQKMFEENIIFYNSRYKIIQSNRIKKTTGTMFRYPIKYNFFNPFFPEGYPCVNPHMLNVNSIEIVSAVFEGLLVNRVIIDKIGNINKNYFLICDDIDLLYRAYKLGHKILFVKDAILFRKLDSKIKNKNFFTIKDYYLVRNRIIFDKKYGNLWIIISRVVVNFIISNLYFFKKMLKYKKIISLKEYGLFLKAFYHGIIGRMGKL